MQPSNKVWKGHSRSSLFRGKLLWTLAKPMDIFWGQYSKWVGQSSKWLDCCRLIRGLKLCLQNLVCYAAVSVKQKPMMMSKMSINNNMPFWYFTVTEPCYTEKVWYAIIEVVSMKSTKMYHVFPHKTFSLLLFFSNKLITLLGSKIYFKLRSFLYLKFNLMPVDLYRSWLLLFVCK